MRNANKTRVAYWWINLILSPLNCSDRYCNFPTQIINIIVCYKWHLSINLLCVRVTTIIYVFFFFLYEIFDKLLEKKKRTSFKLILSFVIIMQRKIMINITRIHAQLIINLKHCNSFIYVYINITKICYNEIIT